LLSIWSGWEKVAELNGMDTAACGRNSATHVISETRAAREEIVSITTLLDDEQRRGAPSNDRRAFSWDTDKLTYCLRKFHDLVIFYGPEAGLFLRRGRAEHLGAAEEAELSTPATIGRRVSGNKRSETSENIGRRARRRARALK
jgi:hypothetical protein